MKSSPIFARYLVCDDHQLTLLALWSLHTWFYSCFCKSGQKLAKLLQDFGICSRAFDLGDASTYRRYRLQNFGGRMGTLSAAFDRLF